MCASVHIFFVFSLKLLNLFSKNPKEYSEMLKTERAPLKIHYHIGKMGIFWHFGNEAVALCERERAGTLVRLSPEYRATLLERNHPELVLL